MICACQFPHEGLFKRSCTQEDGSPGLCCLEVTSVNEDILKTDFFTETAFEFGLSQRQG